MTLVQSLIFAAVINATTIWPVSVTAHLWILCFGLEWIPYDPFALSVLSGMAALALFIYYIHDWASLISSALQVLLFLKKPHAIDDRLLFFIALSIIPPLVGFNYFKDQLIGLDAPYLVIGGGTILFGLAFWLSDHLSRQQKNMLNWNVIDSLFVGMMQLQVLLPGAGRQSGALMACLFRNYNRESAAKFTLLSLAPLLGIVSYYFFQSHHQFSGTPWGSLGPLTTALMAIVGFAAAWMNIRAFLNNFAVHNSGHSMDPGGSRFAIYRMILGAVIILIGYFEIKIN